MFPILTPAKHAGARPAVEKADSRRSRGRRLRARRLAVEVLEDRRMLALGPFLLKDVHQGLAASDPWDIVEVAGIVYFTADDGIHGRELWKSDGTAEGTVMVKDILSGSQPSDLAELTAVGNTLYFRANDGVHGAELWRSDGTEAGTGMVKDIYPGLWGGTPRYLAAVGDTLYFRAHDGVHNFELWKSDGTEAGTVLVKDIRPGVGSSWLDNLTAVGEMLYFRANEGVNGSELWKSDGTEAGTVMVKNIAVGYSSSSPDRLTAVGDTLYFRAATGTHGIELWKSDGTEAGTVLVQDILAGSGSSGPEYLTAVGEMLYFRANDGVHGAELWRSDGTETGTVMVKDVQTGSGASWPGFLTAVGETLYFGADDGVHGAELWKSDGTETGTVMVKDLQLGSGSSSPAYLTAAGGTLYFSACTGDAGCELWTSDGTEAGTVMIIEILPGSESPDLGHLTGVGDALYFTANDGVHGHELWRSNGTAEATVMVKDIDAAHSRGSEARDYVAVAGTTFFVADDGVHGEELWKSDGTEAGTVMVKDIWPGDGWSGAYDLTAVGGTLYFTATDGVHGLELWKSDGTDEGTVMVKDIRPGLASPWPEQLTAVGEMLYFHAYTVAEGYELWKSDGTEAGTVIVKDIVPGDGSSSPYSLAAVDDTLYFTAYTDTEGEELWKSDGTDVGTVMVKDILPGDGSSWPEHLTAVGQTLYFIANDGVSGAELWRSDGTEAGTVLVKDILPGAGSSSPEHLTAVGQTLYFIASDGVSGAELWKSDGTDAGTVLVKDILSGADSSSPEHLTAVGQTLYFIANDGVNGAELWKSDGTDAGTVLVKDILPGAGSSSPDRLTAVGQTLYFAAYDAVSGSELWRSDGTAEGTELVLDLVPGSRSSSPRHLTAVGGSLYFTAVDGIHGSEPWVLPGMAHHPALTVDPPVDSVIVFFPAPMDTGSFSLAEDIASFTGPAGPLTATGYSWRDERRLEINFPPQWIAGPYELVLGPLILDSRGQSMDLDGDGIPGEVPDDQYTATFTVLPSPPNPHGLFPGEQFPVGDGPQSVAAADFNGDGVPDLVTANMSGNNVSVLLGRGDGTFDGHTTFAVGSIPLSVAVADVNGDGVPDLVTANYASHNVSVLLGRGDGTFAAQTTFAAGSHPGFVAIADVNGDGAPDLIAANRISGNVSVLLGRGDGTFDAATAFAVGSSPYSVAVADVNGDGVPDLVTANRANHNVSVLAGRGDGTFETYTTFAVGFRPSSVAAGDFNGDGVPDLVAANSTSNTVSVLVGRGDGTFETQTTFAVGSTPYSVAVADVNGDGTPDVVTANLNSHNVSVLLGRGDGTFAPQTAFAVGSRPYSVVAADVNGDGALDLVTANGDSHNISVLLGWRDGTFEAQTLFPVASSAYPYSIAVADVNGDGMPDLVTPNANKYNVSVLLGQGDGTFAAAAAFGVGMSPRSVAVADVNGDGAADLITANPGNHNVSVLLGRGDGTFAAGTAFAVGTNPGFVAVADINGDGIPDLIAANANSHNVSVLLGRGDGTFETHTAFAVGSNPVSLAVADVNGDGMPDLVTANSSSHNVSVLLGRGDGTFEAQTTSAVGSGPVSVALADVNGDGALDVVAANQDSHDVSVLLGRGDGTFEAQTAFAIAFAPRSVAVADLNGDGLPDLVTANPFSHNVSVLLGWGDGTFVAQTAFAVGARPYSVAVADLNGDGVADLATANSEGHDISVLLGRSRWVKHEPAGIVAPPVEAIEIRFSYPMNVASFTLVDDIASFTGPAGPIAPSGFSWLDGRRLQIAFPAQTLAGDYAMVLGPMILDATGFPLDVDRDGVPGEVPDDRYTATFSIAPLTAPYVTGHSPHGEVLSPVDAVRIEFDRPMDPDSFSLAEDVASFHGPLGAVTPTGFVWVDDRTLEIRFDGRPVGEYTLVLGPDIRDLAGNPLDLDGDAIAGEPFDDQYTATFTVLPSLPSPHGLFPGEQFPTGDNPQSVAIADVNGDGMPDLVTTNSSSHNVSVLLGRGDGTFETHTTFAVGSDPSSVAVADINGDGIPDLVTANASSHNVSVLLGRGDGTFEAQTTFAVGSYPRSVAVADVNGDGTPDLVTANGVSHNVSVLLGRGDGTFEAQTTFAVGSGPYSVAVADVNGDGIPDLITANYSSRNVSVLLGRGDGTFEAQITFAVGSGPHSVAVADVNGDGSPDLLTANYASHSVSVLLGRGDGTFDTETAFGVGSRPYSVAVADVDGDGMPDLVTANSSYNNVSVLLGRGDGTFETHTTFAVGLAPNSVAVADVNGDGAPDLVTANSSSDNISVLLGRGDGTFHAQTNFAVGSGPYSVVAADVNGDGTPDLITANYGSYNVSVLLGRGDGTFETQNRFAVGARPHSVVAADVNGDGMPDLITANASSHNVSVLLGRGDGSFKSQTTFAVGSYPSSVAVADLNGDGMPDLVTANSISHNVSVLLGRGDGTFEAQTTFAVGSRPVSVAIADVNGDGAPDIITANSSGHNVSVLLGRGDGTFAVQATFAVGSDPLTVAVADVNGDGIPDLVTANSSSHNVSVLLGRGDGTFEPQITFVVGSEPCAVAVADVNGDGISDLVTANRIDHNVSVLLGGGGGRFAAQATFAVGSNPLSVAVADVSGDGVLDLITANSSGYNVSVLLGWGRWVRHVPLWEVVAPPVAEIGIHFSHPMDTGSFTLADDVASFTGPAGPITPSDFAWLNDRRLQIVFSAQTLAGHYALVLGPQILDATGTAMDLDRDGIPGEVPDDQYTAAFTLAGPRVTGYLPRGTVTPAINSLRLSFDRLMDTTSFSLAEDVVSFTGPGGAVTPTGFTWRDDRSLEIQFDGRAPGTYTLVLGADILDAFGNALDLDRDLVPGETPDDQYTATFAISAPHVTGHSPSGRVSPPIDCLRLWFDRPMDATSFSLAEDVVSFTGPEGEVTPTGFVWVDDRTLEIAFAPQWTLGPYSLVLAPSVYDVYGNPLDQDRDGIAGEAIGDRYSASWLSVYQGTLTADTTWGPEHGAIVVRHMQIAAGVTLTIEPGTIVKFMSYEQMWVDGRLDVRGTAAQPVIFTSIRDDTVGGDTNADGDATSPAPADWGGLHVRWTGRAELENFQIRFASKAIDANYEGAEVKLSRGILRDGWYGIFVWSPHVQVTVENCLIANNTTTGVFVRASSTAALRNCTIVGNGFGGGGAGAEGIHVGAATLSLQNCIVAFNKNGLDHTEADDSQTTIRNSVFHNPAGENLIWTAGGPMPRLDQDGNLTLDPLFVDLATGNFELAAGSPAIDAGLGIRVPAADILGRPRFDDPGMPNVGTGYPVFVDIGAYERQTPAESGDLAVVQVWPPAPEFATGGEFFRVMWTVTNVGAADCSGPWVDAVYLSRDPHLSADDIPLGTRIRNGDLAPGEWYTQSLTAAAPGEPGVYYVLVRTNAEGALAEPVASNNVLAAANVLAVDLPVLRVGESVSSSVSYGQWDYVRLEAVPGNTLVLSAIPNWATGLYVRKGAPPTLETYDVRATMPNDSLQQVRIFSPQAGTYYVGIYGKGMSTGVRFYTLSAESTGLAVRQVTPDRVGNAGSATIEIVGDNFTRAAQVRLVGAGGDTVLEGQEWFQDASTLFATFDLAAAAALPGRYDLVVTEPGVAAATRFDALTVQEGGTARFSTNMTVPGTSRPGRNVQVRIQYTNSGTIDLPSPLLTLASEAWLSSGSPVDAWLGGPSMSFLALSTSGPAAVLRPGQSESFTVTARMPFWEDWVPFTLYAMGTPGDSRLSEDTDWGEPPAEIDDAPFTRITSQIGTTWNDYLAMLRDNANHLAETGQRVHDAAELFSFEFVQAIAMGLPSFLEAGQDAFCPAPGLPLLFERFFVPDVFSRAIVGALGRGWRHSYDLSLEEQADGVVTVSGSAISGGRFWPDGGGGYVGSGANAQLRRDENGQFVLTDQTGLRVQFYPDGRWDWIEDANGNRLSASYDAGGRLTAVSRANGDQFYFEYDAAGRLVKLIDHIGRATHYAYDASGEHLLSVTGPGGEATGYTYLTGAGLLLDHHLTSIARPGDPPIRFSYDSLGRLTGHEVGGEQVSGYAYSAAGKTFVSDALGNTTTFWLDNRGRIAMTEDPLGNRRLFSYDGAGNLAGEVGPTGFAESFAYDGAGNLVAYADALGSRTTFGFGGSFNNLLWVRDALGHGIRYGYDARGNLIRITYEDGSHEDFEYDETGNLLAWTNRRGVTTAYSYNARGQLVGKDDPDTPGAVDFVYAYDAVGNLTVAAGPEGTTLFAYQAQTGRLVRIDYPSAGAEPLFLTFEYDAAGRRTKSTDQDGRTLNYCYDAAGRLDRMTGDANQLVVDYDYDAAGRPIRTTLGNGVYTTYGYAGWQLVSLINHQPDGTVLSRFDYAYDALGRRVAMDTHYGRWTYQYDENGQLTRAVLASSDPEIPNRDLAYVYDPVGNRVRTIIDGEVTEYTTNNMNQYVQVGDRTYVFDADGNLIQETGPDGTTTYTYNHENRLVAVTSDSDAWQYTYDALGDRVAMDENGVVTRYIVDPVGWGNVVAEYGATGNLVARYDHGHGLLSRVDAVGNAAYYTFDAVGNTSEVSGATGTAEAAYTYQPFGEMAPHVENIPNPFRFVGQYGVMKETHALAFMRRRFYDSLMGRFVNEEPLFKPGNNVFTYADNSPLWYIDPSGLDVWSGGGWETGGMLILIGKNTWIGVVCNEQTGECCRIMVESWQFGGGLGGSSVASAVNFKGPKTGRQLEGRSWSAFAGAGGSVGPLGAGIGGSFCAEEPGGGWGFSISNGLGFGFDLSGGAQHSETTVLECWGRPDDDDGDDDDGDDDDGDDDDGDDDDGDDDAPGGGRRRGTRDWPDPPRPPDGDPVNWDRVRNQTSHTPEDKFGPAGHDAPDTEPGSEARFILPGQVMDYRIEFWNKEDALVPTQDAVIYDVLDPAVVDFSSFEFTRIGFLDWDVPLPGGQAIDVRIDTRPQMNIAVQVTAWFDPDTGRIEWWFHCVDPLTGDYPEDPMAGFLPPFNPVTQHELGWVEFRVTARDDLSSGTRIENQAFVQFDFLGPWGPAPKEGPWVNTIDAGPPTSWVEPLPEVLNAPQFSVRWDGADDAGGSGIASYDIYVSTDGGAFVLWLGGTTDILAEFSGQVGGSYAFYSVATDNVRHREPVPAAAHTATYVNIPPTIAGLTATPGLLARPGEIRLTATELNDPDGQVALAAFYRDANGNGVWDEDDELLGTDDGCDGWSLLADPAGWDVGEQLLFARVRDNDGAWSGAVRVTVTIVNAPPSLTEIAPLTGAIEDVPFTIVYGVLATASDAGDPDGDEIRFRVETVAGGTLTKGGQPVTAGVTLLGPGETWIWTPPDGATGTVEAFTVVAWDGELASSPAVTVQIIVDAAPTTTLIPTLADGTLTIADSDPSGADHQMTVMLAGTNLVISDATQQFSAAPAGGTISSDNRTLTIPLASITGSLVIDLGGGDDALTVDFSGGNPLPGGGLFFDGGEQRTADGDKLFVTGGNTFATAVYDATGVGSGTLNLDGAVIRFTGLEPVDLTGVSLVDYTINVDPLNEVAGTVTTTVAASGGTDTLVSFSDGLESTLIRTITGTLTIYGDDAQADIIHVQSLGTSFAAGLTVDGQGGADEIHLQTGGGLTLAAGRNLSLTAETIGQTGTVTVPGTTTLDNQGAATPITLDNAGNDFVGPVTLTATAADVYLTDTNAIDLGTSTVGGNLTVLAGGAITDSGDLAVGGLASFNGTSITLGGLGKTTHFGSLTFQATDPAGAVTIQEDSAMLVAGGTTAGGSILLTAAGVLTVSSPVASAGGAITLAATGGSGSHLVVNAAVASSGGDIMLHAGRNVTGNASGQISSGVGGGDITIHADYDGIGAGTIQLAGDIIGGTGDLTFTLADCDGALDGDIVSGGNLVKNGSGALRLNGANAYTGATTVNGGYLLVNGTLTQPSVSVFGSNGGTLGGVGTINAAGGMTVDASGRVDPGDVDAGCVPQPGQLTVNANVAFLPGSTFHVQVHGLGAGTGHDQLQVNGTVDLSGTVAGLDGSLLTGTTGVLPVGGEFRIIDNAGANPVGTRFDGLPEGAFVTGLGQLMNISYRAGDGNDVVLTTPGRFDFNGFYGYTAGNYMPVSPFAQKTGANVAGWQTLPPRYFERNWPVEPPYTNDQERLKYDGHQTDRLGNPLTFELDVAAGKAYEVMLLTGDVTWNHDRQQFTVSGSGAVGTSQVIDTWGAGAIDDSGTNVTWGGGTGNTDGTGFYRWIRFTTDDIAAVADGLGKLYVTLQDLGGADATAVILALDIRPVSTVGNLLVARTTDGSDPLPADGMTVDHYTGSGAPPHATLTVTASAGTPLQYARITPDGDLNMFSTQITANQDGAFTFSVLRPATLTNTTADEENWTILVEEVSGLSRGTLIETYTAPGADDTAPLRFDFGISGSPVQPDFLPVIPQTTYTALRGYGWTTRVAGANRQDPNMSALRTDLNYAKDATFRVDLPNGTYSVRVYHANPKYYGVTTYIVDNFRVYAEGNLQYTITNIPAGTTDIQTFTVTVSDGVLDIRFQDFGGQDGNFVVSGIEISAGRLPSDMPLLAVGDPLDCGAASITTADLAPVVAEAAARWLATGLTPDQAATLENVRYRVADLGGAYLGLADVATNSIHIDDDAARLGWSVVTGHSSVVSGDWSLDAAWGQGTNDKGRMTNDRVDLLTVVMHELGHLLGYDHSDDEGDLMAPMLGPSQSPTASDLASLSLNPSLNPSLNLSPNHLQNPTPQRSLLSRSVRPASGIGSDATQPQSQTPSLPDATDLFAALALDRSEETRQPRRSRRSRLERYERELDAWFAELAEERL